MAKMNWDRVRRENNARRRSVLPPKKGLIWGGESSCSDEELKQWIKELRKNKKRRVYDYDNQSLQDRC